MTVIAEIDIIEKWWSSGSAESGALANDLTDLTRLQSYNITIEWLIRPMIYYWFNTSILTKNSKTLLAFSSLLSLCGPHLRTEIILRHGFENQNQNPNNTI